MLSSALDWTTATACICLLLAGSQNAACLTDFASLQFHQVYKGSLSIFYIRKYEILLLIFYF